MKKITLLLPVALLFLASCGGVDSELVASGKNHKCSMKSALDLIAEDPENKEAQDALQFSMDNYKTIIESAEEGDRAALETAIEKAYEEQGCD